ncbi:MAG: ABC transporter permease [Ilumatobacteraceae bacterium]|nr:ABC transporter permease [Ilumatobacteraceae bacterium]
MKQVIEIVRSRNLLWNLTLRELRAKYRRSLLGWGWSMLNPLSQMLIYSVVFGAIFGVQARVGDPSGIDTYGLYLLSGILPWGFINLISGLGLQALTGNAALVTKVKFARETLVFSEVLFSLVQFSIEMSLLCIVLLFFGSPLLPWLPMVVLLMVLLAIFTSGIALILSIGAVFFRDLKYLWTIVTQIWFFSTPVIYDPARVEEKISGFWYSVYHWNPSTAFVRSFRHVTFDGRGPELLDLAVLIVVSFASLAIGLTVFGRFSRRIAEEL